VVGLYGRTVADPNRICLIAQSADHNVASYTHPLSALNNLMFAMEKWAIGGLEWHVGKSWREGKG
jgi:hypothetical protein